MGDPSWEAAVEALGGSDSGDSPEANEPHIEGSQPLDVPSAASWVLELDELDRAFEHEQVSAHLSWHREVERVSASASSCGDADDQDRESVCSGVQAHHGEQLVPFEEQPLVVDRDFASLALHRSFALPEEQLDQDSMKICFSILQEDLAISSSTCEAQYLDVCRRDLRTMRKLVAATAVELERRTWAALEERLAAASDRGDVQLLMYVDFASYDTADFKMTVQTTVEAPLETSEAVVAALARDHPEEVMLVLRESSSGVKNSAA